MTLLTLKTLTYKVLEIRNRPCAIQSMTKFILICLEFELKELHRWQNASRSTAFCGRSMNRNVNYDVNNLKYRLSWEDILYTRNMLLGVWGHEVALSHLNESMFWHLQDLFHYIQTSHAQLMVPPSSQTSPVCNSTFKSNTEFYIHKIDLNTVTSVTEAL